EPSKRSLPLDRLISASQIDAALTKTIVGGPLSARGRAPSSACQPATRGWRGCRGGGSWGALERVEQVLAGLVEVIGDPEVAAQRAGLAADHRRPVGTRRATGRPARPITSSPTNTL